MKKVILSVKGEEILLSEVGDNVPIFAKLKGSLEGLIVYESEKGWILRLGGGLGCSGHSNTREECIEKGLNHDYTFHIVEDGE